MNSNKMKMLSKDSLLSLKGGAELDVCFMCQCTEGIGVFYDKAASASEAEEDNAHHCENNAITCVQADPSNCELL